MQDNNFLFLFLNFWYSLLDSTPEKVANIWHNGRVGISAIKFEVVQIHYLSDIFVAVTVVVA